MNALLGAAAGIVVDDCWLTTNNNLQITAKVWIPNKSHLRTDLWPKISLSDIRKYVEIWPSQVEMKSKTKMMFCNTHIHSNDKFTFGVATNVYTQKRCFVACHPPLRFCCGNHF